MASDPLADEHVPETPDIRGAYPRLSDAQIATLEQRGTRRATQRGETLFREGDRSSDFFVILEGTVAIVEGYGGDERLLEVHGPKRFLGDLILRASLIRRSLLIDFGAGLRIVGSRFSPDTRRLREFAARNRLPHDWIDPEEDPASEALLTRLGVRPEETPVVVWRDQVLRNPSNAELARAVGLPAPRALEAIADLVIVAADPPASRPRSTAHPKGWQPSSWTESRRADKRQRRRQ